MLGIDLQRVTGSFAQRRFLTVAVVVNFIINPLVAWTLGLVFLRGGPDLRIGLILFLVTSCIGWYLIFSELAGGDAGLGVSLLGINLVLQIVLLPVYLLAFAGQASTIDLTGIVSSVAQYLLLPAIAAAATRRGWPARLATPKRPSPSPQPRSSAPWWLSSSSSAPSSSFLSSLPWSASCS